jgi:hypothetical protein
LCRETRAKSISTKLTKASPELEQPAEGLFDQAFGVYNAAGETFDVTRSGIVTQGPV